MRNNLFSKYKTTFLALIISLLFVVICLLIILLGKAQFVLLSFYFSPGLVFGISMSIALKRQAKFQMLIILMSFFSYILAFYVMTQISNISPNLSHTLFGGIGAILLLTSIHSITSINIKPIDYVLAFSIGTLSTFFIWLYKNPNIILISIVLWQTSIAWVINRRVLKSK